MHGEAVHLRFAVWDRWVVARHMAPNSAVYQDACVEFFFSCAEGMYINVETSCIGCSLVQRHAVTAPREGEALAPEQVARLARTCRICYRTLTGSAWHQLACLAT